MEIDAGGQILTDSKIKIFVVYYNPAHVFISDIYQPISNGTSSFNSDSGIITDYTGINISQKNNHYGELTQQYWVWKNFMPKSDAEYIGFCHYRRFLDFNFSSIGDNPFQEIFITDFLPMFEKYTEENILKCIENFDIILPHKLNFKKVNYRGNDIYDQYKIFHPVKDLDLVIDIIKDIYPQYTDVVNDFMSSIEFYSCMNFVMKKELLNEYFEWIFNILTVLEQKTDWSDYIDYNSIRTPAYLAERLINIWLKYNIDKRNLKVLETTSVLIDADVNTYIQRCLAQVHAIQNSNKVS